MYTDRYRPGRFALSRKYRQRHKIKIAIIILFLLLLVAAAVYFGYVRNVFGIFATANVTSVPTHSVKAVITATVVPSASAAQPTASPVPTASPKPTPTPTPTVQPTPTKLKASYPPGMILNTAGGTIEERFIPPTGYERQDLPVDSFGAYLRALKLLPDGAKAKTYTGGTKAADTYAAVLDMDVGDNNLLISADAVIRIHAEYRFANGQHDKIVYHFVSGFPFEWEKWRQGGRISVRNDNVTWANTAAADSSEATFRQYLHTLYNYAASRSLMKYDLTAVKAQDMQPGDVLIKSNGQVGLIADVAVNAAGRKCFLLLQGSTPAQQPQILKNGSDDKISPWYELPENPAGTLDTPETDYPWNQLMRFGN